jgi:hypothetical protein
MVLTLRQLSPFGITVFTDFVHRLVFRRTINNTAFRKLDPYPSLFFAGVGDTLLSPIERATLNQWTTHVSITTAIYIFEIRLCQSQYPVIPTFRHDRQNPLESIWIEFISSSVEYNLWYIVISHSYYYCGIFVQSKNCGPRETVVAR